VGGLFSPVRHVMAICKDIADVSAKLLGMNVCFSPALEAATRNGARLTAAKQTVADLTASFSSLSYDVFSLNALHHWQNHLVLTK
jgi:hypothetical protein